jgi:uncharacterized membrane protein
VGGVFFFCVLLFEVIGGILKHSAEWKVLFTDLQSQLGGFLLIFVFGIFGTKFLAKLFKKHLEENKGYPESVRAAKQMFFLSATSVVVVIVGLIIMLLEDFMEAGTAINNDIISPVVTGAFLGAFFTSLISSILLIKGKKELSQLENIDILKKQLKLRLFVSIFIFVLSFLIMFFGMNVTPGMM